MIRSIKDIRAESPFPWVQFVFPNGVVQMRDANQNEVPLFNLTEFAMQVTHTMAAQTPKEAT